MHTRVNVSLLLLRFPLFIVHQHINPLKAMDAYDREQIVHHFKALMHIELHDISTFCCRECIKGMGVYKECASVNGIGGYLVQ